MSASTLEKIIVLVVCLTPLTNIPQLVKIYTEHSAPLSLTTWILYTLVGLPWIFYGMFYKNRLLTSVYTINVMMYLGILTGILLYN
ncbi:hypothetical protein COU77_03390 [Candidatus Peregrinibacteria bacterium CG10_big_fil_rev_8_21_14_0_10_49_16]|nr:MAG: hypothetical protein COW95_04040 [Candidatus Peregrinibacteria bacterium CG22_combo_CG10-13_8_21_14_all_49_11]PIR51875.1 MAG: hypothetical protein COU77_03390 [Candidatus Peregrinibacteria bacterium CG10_big_fil_rev_8_21_14_0_10_49_16]